MYFQDENNVTIDSLFKDDTFLLRSAAVDGTGKITGPTIYTLDITLNKERFDKIRESKLGLIKANLNTYKGVTPQPEVKFFNDYGISVKLGIQAKGVFNLETK